MSKPIIITTRENPKRRNEIGFILWAEDKSGASYQKGNDAFIPSDDFELIIDVFESVFPLKDPWDNSIEEFFDPCSNHYFNHEICRLIIEKIKQSASNNVLDNPRVAKFKKELIHWLEDLLTYADYLVVYGNL